MNHFSLSAGTRWLRVLALIFTLQSSGFETAFIPAGAAFAEDSAVKADVAESEFGGTGIFARAWQGGVIVFLVLLCLVIMSVVSWAIVFGKLTYLRRIDKTTGDFVKNFWDSRSLNELNSRLNDHPYSPAKEVFRGGYSELVRASQMREQSTSTGTAVHAAIENMTRSLGKAKASEKRKLENYLGFLAITASAAPFIGLFGTVWGIMGAFEGIARTGSASLAAVAPGISEALIATAFGLAAAIPAVIGYNLANYRIRGLMVQIDGFCADFLNIVERYLVSDRSVKGASPSVGTQTPEKI
jgi:biopolymer transport protein TolQ